MRARLLRLGKFVDGCGGGNRVYDQLRYEFRASINCGRLGEWRDVLQRDLRWREEVCLDRVRPEAVGVSNAWWDSSSRACEATRRPVSIREACRRLKLQRE